MIKATIDGVKLHFETAGASFSPNSIDAGTLAMLSTAQLSPTDKVLDLGCGYGVVGIYVAKIIGAHNIVMSDIVPECVSLSKRNAEANGVGCVEVALSDGFDNIKDNDFTLILSNPPYHSDFSVSKRFIEKGFNRLKIGGKLLMVTKRKEWYKNKLIKIFGGVRIAEIDGYFVFCSEKRSMRYAKARGSTNKNS